MGRLHLFELEDQRWCPAVVRDPATAYLRAITRATGMDRRFVEVLQRTVERTGATRIVDLCSGGGGPWVELARHIEIPVVMTDKYPNVPALQAAVDDAEGQLTFRSGGVDARDVPDDLTGLRTMFNSFHHFRPEEARGILSAAVRDRQPILVMEIVQRHPLMMLGVAMSFALAMLMMLTHIRPLRLDWLAVTFLVPLMPALVVWDGLVSCLRVYSPEELRQMTGELASYDWEIERIPLGLPGGVGTVLIGTPKGDMV